MVRPMNKGNKVPYKGYLLNQREYHKYQKILEVYPLLKEFFNDNKGSGM